MSIIIIIIIIYRASGHGTLGYYIQIHERFLNKNLFSNKLQMFSPTKEIHVMVPGQSLF